MMKDTKKAVFNPAVILLSIVFLASGSLLAHGLIRDHRDKAVYDRLAARVSGEGQAGAEVEEGGRQGQPYQDAGRSSEPDSGGNQTGGPWDSGESAGSGWAADWETRRRVYQELYQENPELVGWVRIAGTRIDYPVVQSTDRPGFYLDHDFYGKESRFGTPYLAEECSLDKKEQGLLLYGHHMKNGEMFAALDGYTDQGFYQEHRLIRFDTLKSPKLYEVAAVVRLSASAQDHTLPWQQLLMPDSGEARAEAWNVFEQERLYNTGIRLEPGDEILCLVTCEYTMEDGRLMVVARKKF